MGHPGRKELKIGIDLSCSYYGRVALVPSELVERELINLQFVAAVDGASPREAAAEVWHPWGACLVSFGHRKHEIAMGLPAQLVSQGLDCRQQLQCGRELRSFLLVRGLAGAQDMGGIAVFRSSWPVCPTFSLPLSSRIRISGPTRCSSISSVWKRPPSNFSASGEPQSVEGLWEDYFWVDYFSDPTQWWDNRADKGSVTVQVRFNRGSASLIGGFGQ